ELIESELFGHVKGSFTGALEDKVGKFEQAHAGTLLLDEIGDMSLRTQSKVLRVIEEQRFTPVGSGTNLTVDVRIISATNKNLEERLVLMVPVDRIERRHLPEAIQADRARARVRLGIGAAASAAAAGGPGPGASRPRSPGFSSLQEARAAYERDYIMRKLQEN